MKSEDNFRVACSFFVPTGTFFVSRGAFVFLAASALPMYFPYCLLIVVLDLLHPAVALSNQVDMVLTNCVVVSYTTINPGDTFPNSPLAENPADDFFFLSLYEFDP